MPTKATTRSRKSSIYRVQLAVFRLGRDSAGGLQEFLPSRCSLPRRVNLPAATRTSASLDAVHLTSKHADVPATRIPRTYVIGTAYFAGRGSTGLEGLATTSKGSPSSQNRRCQDTDLRTDCA